MNANIRKRKPITGRFCLRWRFGIIIATVIVCIMVVLSCAHPSLSSNPNQEILSWVVPEYWDPYTPAPGLSFPEHRLIVGYRDETDLHSLVETLGGTVRSTIPEIRVALIQTPQTVVDTLALIQKMAPSGIQYISPNYRTVVPLDPSSDAFSEAGFHSRGDPDDPLFGFQWAHRTVGSHAAWEQSLTGNGVVVAVFDTGVDASHPDLDGQFVTGWSWDPQTEQPVLIPPGESRDTNGHGTHVAGIIAAQKNNGIGIAGLAPMAKIMPIPTMDLELFEKAQSIVWAVDQGAKILQNSWTFIYGGYMETLKDAYDYALSHDSIVVFAAANAHTAQNWASPRSWPGIMVVGASDIHDEVTVFSNGSEALSVVAPGKRILSTVNMYNTGAIEDPDPGKYTYYNGTSMAAPHVSALAAVLFEKHPDASAYQIRRLIEISAAPIDPPYWGQEGRTHNPWTGYGRMDVGRAMEMELPEDAPGILRVRAIDEDGAPTDRFFYVTLVRPDGPHYWGRTRLEGGECSFFAIDPGVYDIYIGEVPREDGRPQAAFAHYGVEVAGDTLLEVRFP